MAGLVRALALLCVVSLLPSCSSERTTVELAGSTMGTTFSIQVVKPSADVDLEALNEAVVATLAAIEKSMSTYDPESELSRFNAHRTAEWFGVSQELCSVVESAQDLSRLSGGAFDITVGALVNAWGFGPDPSLIELPEQERIDVLKASSGYAKLHADCSRPALRKDAVDIYVDLSGYAKGYGVDRLAGLLGTAGLVDYLVEIGGEVRASGANARGKAWAIAIESPQRESRTLARVVALADAAMATSGDYRNYFERAGVFYSHTIDPRTGYPVSHNAAAVTVIAETAAFADGMATALLVLGPEEGLLLAERAEVAALFQLRTGAEIEERMSTSFQREVAVN